MGQILSDEGEQEEAINSLIDALRWDSKNGWALLMIGNIFAKYKNDVPTAMTYYDQALIVNPNDNITMNNIGANLMQQGKLEEAKKYFREALKINDKFPNTYFALGLIAEIENDLYSAFYNAIQSLKLNNRKDTLFQNSFKLAYEIANKIISNGEGKKIFIEYKHKLEFEGGVEIDVIEDIEIPTAAKIEFAENYNNKKHIVRFNPGNPAVEHLLMHELVHLQFVIDARKDNLNQLFVSNNTQKGEFIKSIETTVKKLNKLGISDKSIDNYCSGLFAGLNRQIYNTPIDLFIEEFLNKTYQELRPYQFISFLAIIQEGLKVVTDKKIVELSPKEILSKSKILNLVTAMQLKELFGVDLIDDFKAVPGEIKLAKELYDEYLQYKNDKEPAEEYELVLHWAEDLKLDKYFELVNEKTYRNRTNFDELLESIEKDPFDLETKDLYKKSEMDKFQKSQKDIGTNMAVVMFMVDALQYFKEMKKEEIKKIALEIAFQGTQGFSPDKKDYKITSISNKVFSGYHILAYYYVSWMLSAPEMISQLQLPYDNEYKLALQMHKPKL